MDTVPAEDTPTSQPPSNTPRLIDWTGERCVPWAPDVQVVYEHLHRYLWAAGLVEGQRVLDLASGEGFGAAILADRAAHVVGADIDERSVEHSRLNYGKRNLQFAVADARDLSRYEDDYFEVVVAFEMIEHVEEQERVVDEIQRVLTPDGLLIISTPDRETYGETAGENPFHVRELSSAEFMSLLQARFANVATWAQRTITGSAMAAINGSAADSRSEPHTFFVEREGEEWRVSSSISPLYIVAVASNAELPAAPSESILGDAGIELVRVAERREREARRQEIAELRARAAHDAHTISALDAALNASNRRLRRIEGSVTWQLFQRLRKLLFAALGGEGSRAVSALQRGLRSLGRVVRLRGLSSTRRGSSRTPVDRHRLRTGSIEFARVEHPDVSIVIPLYAHANLTRAALETILDRTEHLSYEVILVDDAADGATKALLEQVRGAQVIVNETNLGYQRSIESGAAAARGRWLVLCNNDIEVQPGWLAAMLDCGESGPDVVAVSPKFIFPDGSLAEAGGIIWRDGTGWNYGRGEEPTCCHYEYRREVDYGSAAALMVRSDFWREVGGFDERFLPMYFEDTDLCFEARSRGHRVMYEPAAHVMHLEGATAGVDESAGHKRHQDENRPKFVQKWRSVLQTNHLPPDPHDPWIAATLRRRPRVLVADHRVPTWDRDSGGLRMRGILEALIGLGCHVSLLPDNRIPLQPYTRVLQRMGVEVLHGIDLEKHIASIGKSLSVVILSRPEVAERWLDLVKGYAPSAAVVYDTVDLHWVREARRLPGVSVDADLRDIVLPPRAKAMRERELALIRAAHSTVVVTEREREQVLEDVPDAAVHVVPNVNEIRSPVPPSDARDGLLFVGGFEHPPNVDAVLTLVGDVMPLVWREHPGVSLTVVGAEPPPEVQALASPLVDVRGWVPDLDPLVDSAKALVAPLPYGAGLKGKVTQALAGGLPVVTTAIGAEGLDALDGQHLLIAEDPTEFAAKVIRVLNDGQLWQRLSQAGQQLAAESCSGAVMEERIRRLLADSGPLNPQRSAAVPVLERIAGDHL